MRFRFRTIALLTLPFLLSACKTDLYTKLDEAEANRMLALLVYHHIPADKDARKEGITLRVDEARFVDAVEVLRQNGLPRAKRVAMQDLFPSGQLVSSPEQEAAKLTYLQSQQLEKMLASMDGVIDASVSVAAPRAREAGETETASAAIFLKYSPEVNLPTRETEIRNLARDAIPGLRPERVSITMQRAQYRYLPTAPAAPPQAAWATAWAPAWLPAGSVPWLGGGIGLLGLTAAGVTWRWRRRRP